MCRLVPKERAENVIHFPRHNLVTDIAVVIRVDENFVFISQVVESVRQIVMSPRLRRCLDHNDIPADLLSLKAQKLRNERRMTGLSLLGSFRNGVVVELDALIEKHDEDWFRNPRAGELVAELMSRGQADLAHELALEVTGKPLDFETLVTRLEPLLN